MSTNRSSMRPRGVADLSPALLRGAYRRRAAARTRCGQSMAVYLWHLVGDALPALLRTRLELAEAQADLHRAEQGLAETLRALRISDERYQTAMDAMAVLQGERDGARRALEHERQRCEGLERMLERRGGQ